MSNVKLQEVHDILTELDFHIIDHVANNERSTTTYAIPGLCVVSVEEYIGYDSLRHKVNSINASAVLTGTVGQLNKVQEYDLSGVAFYTEESNPEAHSTWEFNRSFNNILAFQPDMIQEIIEQVIALASPQPSLQTWNATSKKFITVTF